MTPKRIYVCYANIPDDSHLAHLLLMHISLNKKLQVWHVGSVVAGDEFDKVSEKNFNESEIYLPLLTVSYLNSDVCMNRFKRALAEQKLILPIFAGSFDIDAVTELEPVRKNIILDDQTPIDNHTDLDEALRNVSSTLRNKLFGENTSKLNLPARDSKQYNQMLAVSLLLTAIIFLLISLSAKLSTSITVLGTLIIMVVAILPISRILLPTNVISER